MIWKVDLYLISSMSSYSFKISKTIIKVVSLFAFATSQFWGCWVLAISGMFILCNYAKEKVHKMQHHTQ